MNYSTFPIFRIIYKTTVSGTHILQMRINYTSDIYIYIYIYINYPIFYTVNNLLHEFTRNSVSIKCLKHEIYLNGKLRN